MRKVIRSPKKRFHDSLMRVDNAVVISIPSMGKFLLNKFENTIRKNGFKRTMILKRLFHKIYVGERTKNEKILDYPKNLQLLIPGTNANYQILRLLKGYEAKIVGVLYNQKFERDGSFYIKSKFDNRIAIALLLKKLLTLVAIAIKNSKILNKG